MQSNEDLKAVSKTQQLEKENAQLRAALAEARKEADAWREEFEAVTRLVQSIGQKMAPKRT